MGVLIGQISLKAYKKDVFLVFYFLLFWSEIAEMKNMNSYC
jgi:hypothetical protein